MAVASRQAALVMSYLRQQHWIAIVWLSLCLGCTRCAAPPSGAQRFQFTPVGSPFPSTDLIDLEFLPGQEGAAIVLGKGGTIYFMTAAFAPLSQTAQVAVAGTGEQGLLKVVADPAYAQNHFIYLYLTAPGGGQNQVDRFTVQVDSGAGSFGLTDRQRIIEFPKSDSPSPGSNHNGGGLAFDSAGRLLIGVGDGGGSGSADPAAEIGQDPSTRLGKILRVNPNRTPGEGGFTLPSEGNSGPVDTFPEIFALGLRNPFTLVAREVAAFIGDVGASGFEEINLADTAGLNFGWPFAEGPADNPMYQDPIHGYAHGDTRFNAEDPEGSATAVTPKSIMLGTFYSGPRYDEALDNRLIYAEFYAGWVRGLELDSNNKVLSDRHLTHLAGMTALKQGPDGFLYAVSLFQSDRLLKLELVD